ncbi:phosphotransferase enzyme family-domain-containing protein [Naematelia encephala]|uniref:Phosphotransferase enzyme family-domain-containing protein n=1 Tax=Naematelia encephala TaxID=71784 RepID=A0A1Y2B9A5_9TREE|nr:phosphotransferase enzyme family-domain-containing protein [Naematelia encephala]
MGSLISSLIRPATRTADDSVDLEIDDTSDFELVGEDDYKIEDTFGMTWKEEFDLDLLSPVFSVEPNVEDLLTVCGPGASVLKQFDQNYSKCYKIKAEHGPLLLRLSLPVDVPWKIESEVATMCYIRQHTKIPIPRVLRYDATNENVPHFPYISMEFIPGVNLYKAWKDLPSMVVKERIVCQLASFQAELFDLEFDFIGNLYLEPHADSDIQSISAMDATTGDGSRPLDPGLSRYSKFRPGPIATVMSDDSRLPRGPYHHAQDWLRDRLECCLLKFERLHEVAWQKKGDTTEISGAITATHTLLEAVPKVFPKGQSPESTRIFHDNLHEWNVLIDQHRVVGLLDWECVSVVPVWEFCQLPAALQGPDRDKPPERAHFPPWGEETLDEPSFYWEDLMAYELVHLRKAFMTEMERIRPSWVSEFRRGSFKRAIVHAIDLLEQGCVLHWSWWIDFLADDLGQISLAD